MSSNGCSTLLCVAQLSFFSADARAPCRADLAGLLCAQGQIATFASSAARLWVDVEDDWRARALAEEFAARGVKAELSRTESGHPFVRTAFRSDLIGMARAWTRGAVKSVPAGLALDGPALRLWALAGGMRVVGGRSDGFLLGLDPGAPDTHDPLWRAVARAGLVPVSRGGSLLGTQGGGPAVRISGRKRLLRLIELVGDAPPGGNEAWPECSTALPV